MQEHERRRTLANFLRQQRARLSPTDVGLPPGIRRRTPGLRREEIAQLANIGTSWYVWLEQGRDVHPSAQVLESLAQALRLTLNERRHLFLLAGQPLPAPVSPLEESISPALQQVLDDLNPTPAYVMGRRYDYLAWNKAADGLFSISEASPPYGYNLIWRLFTSQTMRENPNWEMIARATLAEFRTASANYPEDRWFEELIEDLKQISPEFCRWWPHHNVRGALDGHKVIQHATLGLLEFEHLTLQVLSNPDIKIMIYTPNAVTQAKLQRLLDTQASSLSGIM
ncbi:helix-turn-helix transcriptional regulator [Dictyobacter arantiisoli]|uniref:Transcriptional regulator n=1 Tax=Dictyobacter arantiisoli TaxID=2014874 RepID=A0A5A5TFY6_9CHLR|nr:helix-turn-helix transcriptional regulator [Dictyobacter arantiisoli]GCF10277.1 transcriptional regulator [Dictyobacter arantiisoli]